MDSLWVRSVRRALPESGTLGRSGALALAACAIAVGCAALGGCGDDTGAGGASSSTGGGATGTSSSTTMSGATTGSSTSGPSSSTTGSGGSGGGTSGLLLDEGFETVSPGGPPDPAVWTPAISSSGTITVASDRAHRGSQSLHVTAPSGSYETFVMTQAPFPVPNNTFWGRLYFYLEATMPTDFVHWTIMEARGVESNNRIRYGGINNGSPQGLYGHWFLFNVETQGSGEVGLDDSPDPQVPAGEWICMEWKYAGVPGQNDAQLFWNGVERPDVHAAADLFEGIYAMPTFDRLYVGWAIYQPISAPYEVWIDDVAVAPERIGCE